MNQNKVKIIYILPIFSIGGAEKIVFDMAKNIRKDIFEVKIISLKGATKEAMEWEKEARKHGIDIISAGGNSDSKLSIFLRLFKILKKEKPEIVHTNLFLADVLGRIASKLAGVPVTISTEHNQVHILSKTKFLAKKYSALFAGKIVAVSEGVKKYLIQEEKINPRKISIIKNGIDTGVFGEIKKENSDSKLIIGTMGRLVHQKGFDILIKAISLTDNNNLKCLIAGGADPSENLENELRNKINKLGLERKVELVGIEKNPDEFYQKLDVFMLPSRYEGLPLTLLEAGAKGLPVIASDVDGNKEVIDNEKNGLLFKSEDEEDLAKKIFFLSHNKEKMNSLGAALKEKIKNDFNIKQTVRSYEKLYFSELKNYEK